MGSGDLDKRRSERTRTSVCGHSPRQSASERTVEGKAMASTGVLPRLTVKRFFLPLNRFRATTMDSIFSSVQNGEKKSGSDPCSSSVQVERVFISFQRAVPRPKFSFSFSPTLAVGQNRYGFCTSA